VVMPDAIAGSVSSETLELARRVLSGKRVALIGFSSPLFSELTEIFAAAEGFTRLLSPLKVDPSSEILKPFELILVNLEEAAGTTWAESEQFPGLEGRCIAVGGLETLLRWAAGRSTAYSQHWSLNAPSDEVMLSCILSLRDRAYTASPGIGSGSTVVLADDDTSVTAIVRRALERNGMNCEVATTGREALDLITRVKPCAAVLDVHMPVIDGFEVLARMKSVPELAQIRVILLTGSEQEADIIKGFRLGADDYVCKPFNPMELTIRLMRAVGRLPISSGGICTTN
jgi:CheY-like chemotaxis protein